MYLDVVVGEQVGHAGLGAEGRGQLDAHPAVRLPTATAAQTYRMASVSFDQVLIYERLRVVDGAACRSPTMTIARRAHTSSPASYSERQQCWAREANGRRAGRAKDPAYHRQAGTWVPGTFLPCSPESSTGTIPTEEPSVPTKQLQVPPTLHPESATASVEASRRRPLAL